MTGLLRRAHDGVSSVRAVAGYGQGTAQVVELANDGRLPRGVGEGFSSIATPAICREICREILKSGFGGRAL